EDGIRGLIVTGVQTCALPIFGIDVREYRFWRMEADGLRNREEVRIVGGKPVRWTLWIPFEEIRALSARQPPFEPRWRPGRASAKIGRASCRERGEMSGVDGEL